MKRFSRLEAASMGGACCAALLLALAFLHEHVQRPVPFRPADAPRPGLDTAAPPATAKPSDRLRLNAVAAMDAADLELTTRLRNLERERQALRQDNAALHTRLDEVLNWILANFRGKYPLAEKHMGQLQMEALTEAYQLHPDLAEMLRISEQEGTDLNEAFTTSLAILREIEASTLMVTNPRPDKVILSIPPFADAGKALQEELYGAMESTLGAPRFDRLIEVSEDALQEKFGYFGEASRTMIFELAYHADADPSLVIKDAWVLPDGPSRRAIRAVEAAVTNLPSQYLAYLAWLPDYVAEFAVK